MASLDPSSPKLPSTAHRLPTVSASQYLSDESLSHSRTFSVTGGALDRLLSNNAPQGHHVLNESSIGIARPGGIRKGQITEVYGPPGVGKTAMCMQVCASALASGSKVLWIDCGSKLYGPRLRAVLSSYAPETAPSSAAPEFSSSGAPPSSPPTTLTGATSLDSMLDNLKHQRPPTPAHLFYTLLHAPPSVTAPETSLMIIEDLNLLLDQAYPRHAFPNDPKMSVRDAINNAASRRKNALSVVASALQRFAVSRDAAVLVTSQVVTRIQPGGPALLVPSLAGDEWEGSLGTRVALFRDWAVDNTSIEDAKSRQPEVGKVFGGRFARLTGSQHQLLDPSQKVAAFRITEHGGIGDSSAMQVQEDRFGNPGKRSFQMSFADGAVETPASSRRRSEGRRGSGSDEEYGWDEAEDELAAEGLVEDVPIDSSSQAGASSQLPGL